MDEAPNVVVPQGVAVGVERGDPVFVRMTMLRLAALDRVGIAGHERHATVVRVGVVRIGVQPFAVDLGFDREVDPPALGTAGSEQIAAFVAVARDGDRVPVERDVADAAVAFGTGVPGPLEVARLGAEDDETGVVVAQTAVVADRQPLAVGVEIERDGRGVGFVCPADRAVGVERVDRAVPPSVLAVALVPSRGGVDALVPFGVGTGLAGDDVAGRRPCP